MSCEKSYSLIATVNLYIPYSSCILLMYTVGMFMYMTIDDNAQRNSDIKKLRQIYYSRWKICDSPSSVLQIIVLIIETTLE